MNLTGGETGRRELDMDKLEKLRKIKALTDNATGGEKMAAKEAYEKLKTLYNFTDNIVDAAAVKDHEFKYNSKLHFSLLRQIIRSVCGNVTFYRYRNVRRLTIIKCTDFEAAEINIIYDVYKHALDKLVDSAFIAFVNVNDIFPDENVRVPFAKETNERKPLTEKQRQALRLMKQMDKTIVPHGLIAGGDV